VHLVGAGPEGSGSLSTANAWTTRPSPCGGRHRHGAHSGTHPRRNRSATGCYWFAGDDRTAEREDTHAPAWHRHDQPDSVATVEPALGDTRRRSYNTNVIDVCAVAGRWYSPSSSPVIASDRHSLRQRASGRSDISGLRGLQAWPCASGRAPPRRCRRGWRGSGGRRAPSCCRTGSAPRAARRVVMPSG
jgi:hypothetical protein